MTGFTHRRTLIEMGLYAPCYDDIALSVLIGFARFQFLLSLSFSFLLEKIVSCERKYIVSEMRSKRNKKRKKLNEVERRETIAGFERTS